MDDEVDGPSPILEENVIIEDHEIVDDIELEREELPEQENEFGNTEIPIESKKTKVVNYNQPQKKLQKTSKWVLFLSDHRKRYIDENPGLTFPQVTKNLAEVYKNLSKEEVDQLEQRVQEHNKAVEEADQDSGIDQNQSPALLEIPLARVKRCMKLDPDVKNISKESIAVMTKAVELFIGRLAIKIQATAAMRGGKIIKLNDFIHTIHYEPSFDFLRLDFPKSMLQSSTSTSTQRGPQRAATKSKEDQIEGHERELKENQSESTNTNILSEGSNKEAKRTDATVANGKNSITNYFTGKKRSIGENEQGKNASEG